MAKPPAASAPAKPQAEVAPAKPQAEPAPAPATIDFNCPMCDAKIQMPVDQSGKMAPCPECSRIVRVPLPSKKEVTDWRKVSTGPSLARKDTEAAPEGAWGSATGVATVSRETMEEMAAVSAERAPYTRGQWIKIGVGVAALALLALGGFAGYKSFATTNVRDDALHRAAAYLDSKTKTPLDPLAAAAIHRGIGECSLHIGTDESTKIGRDHLGAARTKLATLDPSGERDALLIDIALLQADAVLDPGQIDKAQIRREAERDQERSIKDLERTISMIGAADARALALRLATQKLIGKKLGEQAPRLTLSAGPEREEAAVVALELWRAGQTQAATALAEQLLKNRAEDKTKEKAAPPALVALAVVLKKPQEELDKLKPAFAPDEFPWLLGMAQGHGLAGNFEEARAAVAKMKPADQWYGGAVIASAGFDKSILDGKELAETIVGAAANKEGLATPLANRPHPSWLLLRLVQQALKANKADVAGQVADAVPDPQLRGRAKLELLRAKLHVAGSGPAGDDWAKDIDDKTNAYALAREAIARHNAKAGQGSALLKAVGAWEPEGLRPFGYVGVALGVQEK